MMMATQGLFEDFANGDGVSETGDAAAPESGPLYEAGFKAGWDEAIAAEKAAQKHISADLAQNLRDLGFSFQEAREAILTSLEPIFRELAAKVLPEIASAQLGSIVAEEAMRMAEDLSETPMELAVSAGGASRIKEIVAEVTSIPLTVVEEPGLSDGQVYIRRNRLERKVDLSAALERISQTIDGFYANLEQDMKHG